ncbi:MAG: hypothetical protein KKC84_04595 [Candidatus Omnitrophica bacterium]|nr:hypothetical protein [Candidatus Omnitrophota bacterium]
MAVFMLRSIVFLAGFFILLGVSQVQAQELYREQRPQHADRAREGLIDARQQPTKVDARVGPQVEASDEDYWQETRADKNKDGLVDANERTAWRTFERAQLDFNNDGNIDDKEKRLYWRYGYSRVRDSRLAVYDTNGNGFIDASEGKEYLKDRYAAIAAQGNVKVESDLEVGYDVNADGLIDSAEAEDLKDDLDAY